MRSGAEQRDRAFMRRTLELASRGGPAVAPNPMVGALLVRGGDIVGQGYHRRFGGPHAEAAALEAAGPLARGATLYANLEPCAHHGRTPPCVDALIRAGVRRVVAAMRDPYPRVRGRGLRALRRAGVSVQVGLLGDEARRLNRDFVIWAERDRPFVILKAGTSLDGRIAAPGGRPLALTGARARARAHALRAAVDAILVGAGTVRSDDPLLTARPGGRPGPRQPLRAVLAGRVGIRASARLFTAPGGGPVIVFGTSAQAWQRRIGRVPGIETVVAGPPRGRPEPRRVLRHLRRRGVGSVLIEGGGEIAASFLRDGLVDMLVWFIAPTLLGGGAVPAIAGPGLGERGEGRRLRSWRVRRLPPDLMVEALLEDRGAGHVHGHRHRGRTPRRH
jgi:diaminohydroxyphosphoribosylaminopyrimidine deaminase / 5-amino-6-(5-phosphoribosylamino)uracil reductase